MPENLTAVQKAFALSRSCQRKTRKAKNRQWKGRSEEWEVTAFLPLPLASIIVTIIFTHSISR